MNTLSLLLWLRPTDGVPESSAEDRVTTLILCVLFGVPAAVAIGAAISRRLKKRSGDGGRERRVGDDV